MNRFRFRGRHEYTQLWVTGNGMDIVPARNGWDDDKAYIVNRGCRTEVEMDTVSFTTNKFDIDGEEIFDGDIVEITLELDGEVQPTERYLVEFDEEQGRFKTKFLGGDALQQDDIDFLQECKVVGNKWENPEMLQQPQQSTTTYVITA